MQLSKNHIRKKFGFTIIYNTIYHRDVVQLYGNRVMLRHFFTWVFRLLDEKDIGMGNLGKIVMDELQVSNHLYIKN